MNDFYFIKDIIPKEFCYYLTHALLRNISNTKVGDDQVPNCISIIHHDLFFETLQERIWPIVERRVGEELSPTYSYARLYCNGDNLEPHTDRPACEVSVTIQLGRSHNYSWPIYMGGSRFDLAEGDGIIYRGCDVEHWRNSCDGPDQYYSGQVFMHFVRSKGINAKEFGDSTVRNPPDFVKNRTFLMENK